MNARRSCPPIFFLWGVSRSEPSELRRTPRPATSTLGALRMLRGPESGPIGLLRYGTFLAMMTTSTAFERMDKKKERISNEMIRDETRLPVLHQVEGERERDRVDFGFTPHS